LIEVNILIYSVSLLAPPDPDAGRTPTKRRKMNGTLA